MPAKITLQNHPLLMSVSFQALKKAFYTHIKVNTLYEVEDLRKRILLGLLTLFKTKELISSPCVVNLKMYEEAGLINQYKSLYYARKRK